MAPNRISVDSSLIIDFFRKSNKPKTPLYSLFQKKAELHISTVTVYELLCGAERKELVADTEKILELFRYVDFSEKEARIAARIYKQLRRKNQLIEPIDILIAATAISHSMELSTLNVDHFSRFSELKLL